MLVSYLYYMSKCNHLTIQYLESSGEEKEMSYTQSPATEPKVEEVNRII